ncbi:MAG: Uma2 family endonuclease [Planctomycetes bacterium]|nr:Uma2 family endonuclease [Planctomycetota bacterium]
MATATARTIPPPSDKPKNLADLVERLGDIPLERILLQAPPGTATEQDVLAARATPEKRLCELVDGVLVEKAMGTRESWLAVLLIHHLMTFLEQHDLGLVLGADGMLRFFSGRVRIPDVSFLSWERLPGRELPDSPIADLVPDLAVEVLSKGNTKKEMARKLRDYFQAGVRLVWLVDPKSQAVDVYTSATKKKRLTRNQILEGGEVLPGFTLPLRQLFTPSRRATP